MQWLPCYNRSWHFTSKIKASSRLDKVSDCKEKSFLKRENCITEFLIYITGEIHSWFETSLAVFSFLLYWFFTFVCFLNVYFAFVLLYFFFFFFSKKIIYCFFQINSSTVSKYRFYIWVFKQLCVHLDTIILWIYKLNFYSSHTKRLVLYRRFSETFPIIFILFNASIVEIPLYLSRNSWHTGLPAAICARALTRLCAVSYIRSLLYPCIM